MRLPRVVWPLALAVFASAGPARADEDGHLLGAAVGYSTQFETALFSLDFLCGINRSFTVVPNASYGEAGSLHRWTAGVELQWNAPIEKLHPKLVAWLGGGMNWIIEDPKGPGNPTANDLVIDAVAGVGWDGPASPFLQVRAELKDHGNVGLSIGVRF